MRPKGSEWRALFAALRRQGWTEEHNRGHAKWRSPDGKLVSMSGSPSDVHACANAIRDCKRLGLVWP